MPTKKTKVAVVSALDRVLDGLGEELVLATDEEILEAARDLGMDPTMRGSAAFLGLKYTVGRTARDFFEGFDVAALLPGLRARLEGRTDAPAQPVDEGPTDEAAPSDQKPPKKPN